MKTVQISTKITDATTPSKQALPNFNWFLRILSHHVLLLVTMLKKIKHGFITSLLKTLPEKRKTFELTIKILE